MKRKVALFLVIVFSLIVFCGCNNGGWRVDNHAQTSVRTVFYLKGNDGITAEYTVQGGTTKMVISWASSITIFPQTRDIEIYCDDTLFKNRQTPMHESFFEHTYSAEPNSSALFHKFTVKPMSFQYEKVQIIVYNDDGTLLTDKTFPVKNIVKKVEDYANKKKISLT